MPVPTSTYRLQFRGDMTFERATELVPYLKDLGISHVYASPIFTATKGSTHGYDVTDANEIDPVLGGRRGFDTFMTALQQAGLGLIVDIVPNHMAASLENPWWRDVLRLGPKSAYAEHFDIDWSRRLTLPQLGKPLEEALAAGEFEILCDPDDGLMQVAYFDNRFPLSDESVWDVLAQTAADARLLQAFSRDAARMKTLLEKQHWQLLHWRDAADNLSYRRFFEVVGLVGMRVEDKRVFEETHRLTIELVRSGQVQGLRVDHIDGLADPGTYLERLRKAVGPDIFIVVEKILGTGEVLSADWPVSGTTGYEFISAMADLFVAEDGLHKIDATYRPIGEEHADFAMGLRRAKLLMVERNFAGEVGRLTELARLIFPDFSEEDMSATIRELLVAFPVYRTYGCGGPLSPEDEAVLCDAISDAQTRLSTTFDLGAIATLLRGDVEGDAAFEFRTRFQQLSGPVMAKAVEDTLFYRYNRLIASNEVGGDPAAVPGGVAAFHQFMADRLQRQPEGLSATATHDTKRGEDARARLYSLTQHPEIWTAGVERWRAMNAGFRSELADGAAPGPNVEWMLYQALAGIWPKHDGHVGGGDLGDRFKAYALKAMREAKLRTDWMDENPVYEKAVQNYAQQLLSPENAKFLGDFEQTLRPFIEIGYLNSLSQLLIKLTAPGIPDIYQGSEGLDFSMVDPDNRRPVVYEQADTPNEAWAAALKRRIIRNVLLHRRDHPRLFLEGGYVPLEIIGARASNLVAFARTLKGEIAVTVVPRLVEVASFGSDFWRDTAVVMPLKLDQQMHDLLTGNQLPMTAVLAAQLFADHPVAFLVGSN
ncbi:malto-oligosyltrehalose synthase [Rhizobium rhizogenes]|uniref:malto-oligosyltrehalose synthase n=1 Tax=Rhizobium rhizogenes TaxID=359 RepID=UPI00226F4B26|nr:malto-oligosyltrehalose synthase [Rhizobium rhizogenes]